MGTAERKLREKELRRKQILKAAEKIFIKKGLVNTTMDEIADVCELSKGTLYLYFKSKEDLFFTIIIEIMNKFIRLIEKNVKGCATYEMKTQSIGEAYLEFYKKHPQEFKMMNHFDNHTEKDCFLSEMQFEAIKNGQRIWDKVKEVIQEGIDLGLYKKDTNPMEVGITIWASSNGMISMIDHIKTCHLQPPMVDQFKNLDTPLAMFEVMDYEKMLRNLWDAIIDRIRVK